ncbi:MULTISPECIES: methyl-accepting chemotaxis protein [Agrobacterium]|uniref:HAMP domain-containing protein n=1 Tax=Agrobacterium tumefaciens TaxID=358 RepID=A0AAE6BH46_AGRTU|nr:MULTISPECIES: methyl-accepting chemotaxis protein [Agrobacterium]QCL77246.1 HAMP domain-containing protein [Agrobacterium tumefaciens]QCL82751.1 HAMP domain-containing protein [Agrobacterium tumefaciens]CUX72092.1 Methyl-accepting chemotaxis protein [Agrobacterium sp. NCPPB 925]
MKHISIIGKFLIIMAAFGLFSLGMAFYSGQQIKRIDASYNELLGSESKAALYMARSNRALQAFRASVAELLLSRTPEHNATAQKNLKDAEASFVKSMDTAIASLPEKSELPVIKADVLNVFKDVCGPTIAAGLAATSDQGVAASQQAALQCEQSFSTISLRFTELTNAIVDSSDKQSSDLTNASHQTFVVTLSAVVLGLLAVLLLGFVAIRAWLVKPILNMVNTMGVLANGDFTATVEGTDRRDEVGTMAKAVQIFKENGLRALQLEQEAASGRSASEAERARVAEADRQRAQQMAQATSGLGEGLKHLSSGDLTYRLTEPFASDFETLRSDFNAAVSQLAGSLRSVSQATGSIDSGAREISQSAEDLSKRTEQQAASLEETAAALDQITTNVANSSQRTQEARHVAIEANKSASRSGEVVSNAVIAMQRIEHSSNQISNIIGVIDEIAFQTNLLALNAGVEAARAGEAGKGFAVVAQEVRELAQRSAQAAKEIKELIRNSSEEVSTGVKLVQETGLALKVIEEQVVTINTQLDAIATSAKEQSVGLHEVNTAVNQMDQVTQQNAAMVEESTAASANLASEVQRLREIISGFRVGSEGFVAPGRPVAAKAEHRPLASPARRMVAKLSGAIGFAGSAAASAESWEEF